MFYIYKLIRHNTKGGHNGGLKTKGKNNLHFKKYITILCVEKKIHISLFCNLVNSVVHFKIYDSHCFKLLTSFNIYSIFGILISGLLLHCNNIALHTSTLYNVLIFFSIL